MRISVVVCAWLMVFAVQAAGQPAFQSYPFNLDFSQQQMINTWGKLHRSVDYPFPSASLLEKQLKNMEPDVRASVTGSSTDLAILLQSQWFAFFQGDFEKTIHYPAPLGSLGQPLALYAKTIYAFYLEKNLQQRKDLFLEVINGFENQPELAADDYALFSYVYAMARLSEELPLPQVLYNDYINKMQVSIARLIERNPNHAYALATKGAIDAGIIRKVGNFIGGLSYSAKPEVVEAYFAQALEAGKDIAILREEYALAQLYVYKKTGMNAAINQLKIAVAMQPMSAKEKLDIERAKKRLSDIEKLADDEGKGIRNYISRDAGTERNYYL